MANKRTWKDFLLSSGLPLEYSVERLVKSSGLISLGPCSYRRQTEEGQERVFSVDLAAVCPLTKYGPETRATFLFECKYRHDGIRWVFTPNASPIMLPVGFSDWMLNLDAFNTKWAFVPEGIDQLGVPNPRVSRFIELLPDDSNPKTIEQALHQLRHAVYARFEHAIAEHVHHEPSEEAPVDLIVPVVVTTAELWTLRKDVSIEGIRRSNDIGDVAEQTDLVMVRQPPSTLQVDAFCAGVKSTLTPRGAEHFRKALERGKTVNRDAYLSLLCQNVPSAFLVATYSNLQNTLRVMVEGLKGGAVLVSRALLDIARSAKESQART